MWPQHYVWMWEICLGPPLPQWELAAQCIRAIRRDLRWRMRGILGCGQYTLLPGCDGVANTSTDWYISNVQVSEVRNVLCTLRWVTITNTLLWLHHVLYSNHIQSCIHNSPPNNIAKVFKVHWTLGNCIGDLEYCGVCTIHLPEGRALENVLYTQWTRKGNH